MPDILPKRLGVPYKSLPNDDEYDYYNAYEVPSWDSHWSSRNPSTGRILKSNQHPTFMSHTVPGEQSADYQFYTDPLGNLYSFGSEDEIPYLQRPLMTKRKYTAKPRDFFMDPEELAMRQAYVESVFKPDAINTRTGPIGMFQIMPENIKAYQEETGDIGDPKDPHYNRKIRDWLWDRFGKTQLVSRDQPEEVRLAKQLAAYNWKIKDLSDLLVRLKNSGIDIYSDNSWMNEPEVPQETRDYINYILYHKPTKYRSDEQLNEMRYLYDRYYTDRRTK